MLVNCDTSVSSFTLSCLFFEKTFLTKSLGFQWKKKGTSFSTWKLPFEREVALIEIQVLHSSFSLTTQQILTDRLYSTDKRTFCRNSLLPELFSFVSLSQDTVMITTSFLKNLWWVDIFSISFVLILLGMLCICIRGYIFVVVMSCPLFFPSRETCLWTSAL